jgi:hypothetical protein
MGKRMPNANAERERAHGWAEEAELPRNALSRNGKRPGPLMYMWSVVPSSVASRFTSHVFIRLTAHSPIPSASICRSSSSFSLARRRFHAGLVPTTYPTARTSRLAALDPPPPLLFGSQVPPPLRSPPRGAQRSALAACPLRPRIALNNPRLQAEGLTC